jgi:hypothetical protein
MRATILALGLAALAAASDVHDLKKDTFKDFIKENDLVLAECAYPSPSLLPKASGSALTVNVQSLRHGADTAKPSLPSMRRLRPR